VRQAIALILGLGASCGGFDGQAARRNGAEELKAALEARAALVMRRGALTEAECLEAALTHGLELRVADLEALLAGEQAGAALLDLLPRISARIDPVYRNQEPYSKSTYLVGRGGIRDSYATSARKESLQASAEMAWSPLDFGLSWLAWRQARLEVQRREALRLRVAQKLAARVLAEHRRLCAAAAAGPCLGEAEKLLRGVAESLTALREEGESSALQVAHAEQEESGARERFQANAALLLASRAELAADLGLDPGAELEALGEAASPAPALPELGPLLEGALAARPELGEADLMQEQARLELKKAWLRLFPNVQLFHSLNHDVNPHLLHRTWYEAGARITIDLIRVVLGSQDREAARAQIARLGSERELAGLNVLLQVRLAHLEYARALARLAEAREALERSEWVALELGAQARSGVRTGLESRQAQAAALTARAEWLVQLAEAWAAYRELCAAAGRPQPLEAAR